MNNLLEEFWFTRTKCKCSCFFTLCYYERW